MGKAIAVILTWGLLLAVLGYSAQTVQRDVADTWIPPVLAALGGR